MDVTLHQRGFGKEKLHSQAKMTIVVSSGSGNGPRLAFT